MKKGLVNKKKINFTKNNEYVFQIPVTIDPNIYLLKIETLKTSNRQVNFSLSFKLFINSSLDIKQFDFKKAKKTLKYIYSMPFSEDLTILSCNCNESVEMLLSIIRKEECYNEQSLNSNTNI